MQMKVRACAWRIVISPMIPQEFPSCYYSSMRNLAVLVVHLIATLAFFVWKKNSISCLAMGMSPDESEFLRSSRSIWLQMQSDNVEEMTRKMKCSPKFGPLNKV